MSSAYDYDNSLVVLLVALLVVTCVLVLFVCVFARKIMQYRMQEKIKHSVPGTISRNSG